jgi:hypothetical protein
VNKRKRYPPLHTGECEFVDRVALTGLQIGTTVLDIDHRRSLSMMMIKTLKNAGIKIPTFVKLSSCRHNSLISQSVSRRDIYARSGGTLHDQAIE